MSKKTTNKKEQGGKYDFTSTDPNSIGSKIARFLAPESFSEMALMGMGPVGIGLGKVGKFLSKTPGVKKVLDKVKSKSN